MLNEREILMEICNIIGHRWVESYYGWLCQTCLEFIPFGCEPWAPDDEEAEKEKFDFSAYHYHGCSLEQVATWITGELK